MLIGQKEGIRRSVRRILELRGHRVIERASLHDLESEEVDAVFAAMPLHGGDIMKLHAKTGTLPMVGLVVSDSLLQPSEARLFLDVAERAQGAQGIEDLVDTLEEFTNTGDLTGHVGVARLGSQKAAGEPDD
ncbi:MAG: hypothetical protein AAF447_16610 [Myxococcota bacterium]